MSSGAALGTLLKLMHDSPHICIVTNIVVRVTHAVVIMSIMIIAVSAGERPPQEEFLENLSLAAQALQQAILPVLEFISGKTVAEL